MCAHPRAQRVRDVFINGGQLRHHPEPAQVLAGGGTIGVDGRAKARDPEDQSRPSICEPERHEHAQRMRADDQRLAAETELVQTVENRVDVLVW